jgi:2-polyprenyl-6-hydroxyphenyl methylase/3-demethylubiquinone-9 3-methyltransferase
MSTAEEERLRFAFGKNWLRFAENLDEKAVAAAEASLKSMLGVESLTGKRFLDIGSGSGLFSLAARRLGAEVRSFDYDENSVACTQSVKSRFFPDDARWDVEQGSVLDGKFMSALGTFDVVYAWGVLHHTGSMWPAVDNAANRVAEGGKLFIALYNDQGWRSGVWRAVKWLYNALPSSLRFLVLWPAFVRTWAPTIIKDGLRGSPWRTWSTYGGPRGMSPWRDVVDWVGGYPFEVASIDAVLKFCAERRLFPLKTRSVGSGYGCNEFVLEKR